MVEMEELPPEERIRLLKEKQEEMKKAIAEAQRRIDESEGELEQKHEQEVLLREQVTVPPLVEETEGETEESLEGVVGTTEAAPVEGGEYRPTGELSHGAEEYIRRLSQEPAQNLYRSMAQIQEDVSRQGGYVSSEQQRNIQYINSAMDRKIEDAQAGDYSVAGTLAENVERAHSAIRQMRDTIADSYKRGDSADTKYMRDGTV